MHFLVNNRECITRGRNVKVTLRLPEYMFGRSTTGGSQKGKMAVRSHEYATALLIKCASFFKRNTLTVNLRQC